MTSPSHWGRRGLVGRVLWLTVFAAAFGCVEGAVVVYLRKLYYPGGFTFPLQPIPEPTLFVELVREFATLVMLVAVARLAARTGWGRFGAFSLLFGVWDIVFYLTLYAVLGWPESLMTWDVLFLLPLVWVGPVLSAVLVAVSLCGAGTAIFIRAERGSAPRTPWWVWAGALVSLVLLLYAFMANHGKATGGGAPGDMGFPWIPYALGVAMGWAAFGAAFAGRRHGATGRDAGRAAGGEVRDGGGP